MSSADELRTSSRRVGVFLFVFFFFFFLPTQRGCLKWTDYSSHERQHNSRVTFEPYRDKKKKVGGGRKYSLVQRWFSHNGGKSSCYKDKTVAAAICRFTAGDLTQPVTQALCDAQESSFSAQLPVSGHNKHSFFPPFFLQLSTSITAV